MTTERSQPLGRSHIANDATVNCFVCSCKAEPIMVGSWQSGLEMARLIDGWVRSQGWTGPKLGPWFCPDCSTCPAEAPLDTARPPASMTSTE